MSITRHFIRVGDRRVHYRKAGSGPPLLMVHQSPRSSAEYEPLMERWSRHFTCIAPDTPGFGQSDPLPGAPEIEDFAQALLDLLDALGIAKTAAYGFHSGGVILISAVARRPERFIRLASGGYAIWTPEESTIFGKSYLPPFQPSAYGEHLTWLWNRLLEQTWFFPWFDVRDAARMRVAHDDPEKTHASAVDMLDSGDAYRAGYGAVLRASREIPPVDATTIPVLIAAYDGDPLQAHISRFGPLPPSWRAEAVRTPADLEAACLAHLLEAEPTPAPALPETSDAGFVRVTAAGFAGLIHWRGARGAERVLLHAPGREAELLDTRQALAIDLPGHGLSDDWKTPPTIAQWAEVAAAAVTAISTASRRSIVGEGFSALLAADVARRLGATGWGAIAAHIPQEADGARWVAQAMPDRTPDRFGGHLTASWSAVRAAHFFWPWFEAKAANAIPFDPAAVAPEALALEHRAFVRARSGQALLEALAGADRTALVAAAPPIVVWERPEWAARPDVWAPQKI